ncbi:MAG: DMT family transporter, partial [Treponema sp.]|nr:DMT family transporter [Treponema sp.]
MTNRNKAIAAVTASVLFWGFSFVSIKIAVAVIPPMTLGAIRFAMAMVFLFFIKRKYAKDEKIQKEDIPYLVGAGLTGVTLYFFFENNGVALIQASEASLIVATVPVITLIAEALGEKIVSRRKKAAGTSMGTAEPGVDSAAKSAAEPDTEPAAEPDVESVVAKEKSGAAFSGAKGRQKKPALYSIILPGTGALISLAGVALVAGVSFVFTGTAKGYLFMTGACVSWVIYCFLTRPLFSRRSQTYIVFWQSLIGLLGFLPFTFFEASWRIPNFYVWGHVIFLGIGCSALGYWFYAQALKVLGVGRSSLFLNFIPV